MCGTCALVCRGKSEVSAPPPAFYRSAHRPGGPPDPVNGNAGNHQTGGSQTGCLDLIDC